MHYTTVHTERSSLRRATALAVLTAALMSAVAALTPAIAGAATAEDKTQFSVTAGSLSFSTTPAMPPTLSPITLNGSAQTTNTAMTNFGIDDATGSGSGWNT